jgi:hypothetical protein
MMEALCSSETPVLTRAGWHNIPEDGILHSHRHENLTPYNIQFCHKNVYSRTIKIQIHITDRIQTVRAKFIVGMYKGNNKTLCLSYIYFWGVHKEKMLIQYSSHHQCLNYWNKFCVRSGQKYHICQMWLQVFLKVHKGINNAFTYKFSNISVILKDVINKCWHYYYYS